MCEYIDWLHGDLIQNAVSAFGYVTWDVFISIIYWTSDS